MSKFAVIHWSKRHVQAAGSLDAPPNKTSFPTYSLPKKYQGLFTRREATRGSGQDFF